MFFSLTPETRHNFACHFQLGRLNLWTDRGWRVGQVGDHNVVYKGYADDFDLATGLECIIGQSQPEITGNFCVISHDLLSGDVAIKHDRWRSYPLFMHDHEITNLLPSSRVAWTDSEISCDQTFVVREQKFDTIGVIDTSEISADQALEKIHDILQSKTRRFLSHNTLPIKAHLTGGVDSLLVYALLHDQGADMELVTCSHFDYDSFWLCNDTQILQNFWGYGQLHHWREPCVLTSGAPGDEFMLRSPTTLDQLLKYRGRSTLEILEHRPHCLHGDYFRKATHQKIFHDQVVDRRRGVDQFYWDLCNIVVNDWQHWHLGHTLTWTPLRDLDVFKICLRLEPDAAVDQMFDSALSRRLIEQLCPGLSASISDQKNSANPRRNLSTWLFDRAR